MFGLVRRIRVEKRRLEDFKLGSSSLTHDSFAPESQEEVVEILYSTSPVDHSCYLVVEAFDSPRGDLVFNEAHHSLSVLC